MRPSSEVWSARLSVVCARGRSDGATCPFRSDRTWPSLAGARSHRLAGRPSGVWSTGPHRARKKASPHARAASWPACATEDPPRRSASPSMNVLGATVPARLGGGRRRRPRSATWVGEMARLARAARSRGPSPTCAQLRRPPPVLDDPLKRAIRSPRRRITVLGKSERLPPGRR